MTIQRENFSWAQFELAADYLAGRLYADEKYFSCIVGITRGGIFLAGKLAYLMHNKNLYTIAYKSYKGTEKSELKEIYPIHQDLHDKTVLLVDDIADTGDTLKKAKEDLERRRCKVIIATLHYKPSSKIKPNYYINETINWINYPWED
jgi:hypoxanthine phosphoribosyltransferase